jgi:poly-gamma-glutamate capsule biosynthesis protein CapA/YwtB (metallophosphatase superfamily)
MEVTRRAVLAAGLGAAIGVHGTVRGRNRRSCPATVGSVAEQSATDPSTAGTSGTDARAGTDARIGFAGDVMLGRSVDEHWRDRDPAGVWDGLVDRLDALDGLVCNLECTLSDRGERRPGRTYYFRGDPEWAVPALEAAGVKFASLANNHLLDFGPVALADTRSRLADAEIAHAGAGPDRETAFEPTTVEVGGLDVGVLALTDQSRSYAAGGSTPGTAYLALDHRLAGTRRVVDRALRDVYAAGVDLVVASLHWGPNWVVRPGAAQRAFARWLVDRGVDVVHGHSAHVIQGVEVYRGRPVVYDAGDFVDDYVTRPGLHNKWSALFDLEIRDGRLTALEAHPVVIDDETVHPADAGALPAADEGAGAWVRDRLRTLSEPFGTVVERSDAGVRIPLGECHN